MTIARNVAYNTIIQVAGRAFNIILTLLMEKDESGVFNLGTGKGYTVFEVIDEVE
ncbi:MAG: hypothetical protein Q7S37_05200 [bacterium]|nr:hypothetical protein [bacterium]